MTTRTDESELRHEPSEGSTPMSIRKSLMSLVLVAALGVLGCDSLSGPNTNNPSVSSLAENPTAAAVASAAQGMQITNRANVGGPGGTVSTLGIVGRTSLNLDAADPRWVSELMEGPLDPAAFGGFMWFAPYRDIRQGNLIRDAVPQVSDGEMPQPEKEAVLGFVKTLQAYDFLQIIVTRDENGAPVDVGTPVNEDPAPVVDKRGVYDHIVQLLDEAQGHLQSAGGSFPFELSSGYTDGGFDTPATFLEFNRALAARVFVYMAGEFDDAGFYSDALTALDASFLDEGASLDLGVYHAFGTGSGDATNGIAATARGGNPNIRAHPSLDDDVEMQGDGETPDARFLEKTRPIDFREFGGIGSDIGFDIYQSNGADIPIIRNEELILLRAEANIGLGNLALAEDDINLVRTESGGLPEKDISSMTQAQALDALLYEKKYSLLFEGGHHWIDMRRYDRLGELPIMLPSGEVHTQFPFPDGEQRARQ